MVRFFENTLRQQLAEAGAIDGICFALHGANSAVSIPDLDGHILKILRQVAGGDIPIICTLDFHAVVTEQMLDLCDGFFAYRTHPHVDLVETGNLAASTLLDQLQGRCKPTLSYKRIPLLLTPPDQGKIKIYQAGDCPNVEAFRQNICLLKTGMQTLEKVEREVTALKKTIKCFG